ncbi:hypothetical protein R1flu_020317 [Riccia fluitans]|uniref:Uncharacterized protein n=1 Tax=Riccia fluitans TaxID=41844 RepID=A0ABD1ZPZ0_9MARC
MASKSKRVNSKPDGKANRYVLKESDYELIVSYLEEPENFAALFGSGGKTKIGGMHQTKITAFAIMSVRLQSLGFPPCSAANLCKKVTRYRSRYESVLSILKQKGSGLTDEEIARELTLEVKLNKACPFFYRIYTIFGTKANMVPPATCELGIPEVPTMQVISEDKKYEEEDLTCLRRTGENPMQASYTAALSFIVAGKKPVKDGFVADSQVEMSPIQEEDPQNVHDEISPNPTEELRKKEEFRKSLLEAKLAILQVQRVAVEQKRMERKKAFELEQEERRVQRKTEVDSSLATKLFTELAKNDRPLEEVKILVDFFF